MDFLFKVAYYAGTGVAGFVIGGLFLANLLGSSPPGETWRNKAVLTVAAACGFALLYVGIRLGHQQSQWLAGLGMAALALVAAGLVMFFGMMMFTKVHWQSALVKLLFYILYGFFGLMGVYFVLSSLAGRFSLGGASQISAKAVLVIAALAGGAILYWAYQLGELQGRWLPAIGVVLLAVVAFQLVVVIGRITLG